MTSEEANELINSVRSMAIEPPWCENVEQLKKWTEGFEECQYYLIRLIESKKEKTD